MEAVNPDVLRWARYCHVVALSVFIGVPFGNILGPLVLWLIRREEPFVNLHGKESLNLHINLAVYMFVVTVGMFGGMFLSVPDRSPAIGVASMLVGGFSFLFLMILSIIGVAHGALRAHAGREVRFPLIWRVVR